MIAAKLCKAAALSAALTALSGCGGALENPLITQIVAGVGALGKSDDGADPRANLTREALDAAQIRLIYVEIPAFPSQATLQEIGRNRAQITWRSVDGVSVTFEQGFLVGTRGYGDDLMGADIAAVKGAIRAGQGRNVLRVHDYLDGSEDIQRRSFLCDISSLGGDTVTIVGQSVAVQRYVERCQNPELRFENRYDIGRDGRLVASRQWVSPTVGYMVTEELSR